jgi:hypothetical protein
VRSPAAAACWVSARQQSSASCRFGSSRSDELRRHAAKTGSPETAATIADPFGDGNTSRRGAGAPLRAVNLSRMVNRNDAAVTAVYIGGRYLFGGGTADPVRRTARTGRFLRAGSALPRRARDCRRTR